MELNGSKSQGVIIVKMKDLAALFKAFVMPYTAVCSVTTICWLTGIGEEVPVIIWGLLIGSLGEMGIHWSVSKLVGK